MTKKNIENFGLKLDPISQSSSPDPHKGLKSPVRTCRARVHMGGFSDTYRSFFKRENEVDVPNSKGVTQKMSATQSLAEKQRIIQDLQQKIMKQTVKKNAREKSYAQRVKTNWRSRIQALIKEFIRIGLILSRGSPQISRSVLNLLYRCNQKKNRVQKLKLIMHWISLWLKPIFAMISWVCHKNIS